MKTLNNHLILFDAECPMCRAYTRAFTYSGLLDKDGRAAYQDLLPGDCPLVDRQRAVNEIALVNKETGEVTYGISSLFKVAGTALPFLQPLFAFRPFLWLAERAYAFVSYNRRVIVPAAARGGIQPDFIPTYRLAYLALALILTVVLLNAYTPLMSPLLPAAGAWRELFICSSQFLFQALVVLIFAPGRAWDYLGNMATVSLAGALLLWLVRAAGQMAGFSATTYTLVFILIAGLMFLEHLRRCKLLGLGLLLSVTWAAFRLAVLYFIL
ncbi:DCC1-like thiol-disulfide oxidoreductase family protein [Pedobacter sp. SYP-B3415]|uniref:DCC1-like thiol-disulfide oxidoreductase family protein n=1 Tax=Pedobacter sp. SYP-B3415 TaxID=2496641 RepID=UPI00101B6B87|nr:DCC1-like thiol-disulfide oxidoreductase family protein [Pedobacter sp. SYP-B3415]